MTAHRDRAAAIGDFYAAHHRPLERRVSRQVSGAGSAVIEDACQFAWTVLLRRPDVDLDPRGLAWLTTVAVREGRRAVQATDIPTGAYALSGERGVTAEPGAHPDPPVAEQVIDRQRHADRVRALQQLKPAEREALALQGLGYSYREIGELTAASYTAVDRRIKEGRAALRRLTDHQPR